MKSKKNEFISIMKSLEEKRIENILNLMQKPFEELKEMEKYYYDWYRGAEESGYKESTKVNREKYRQIEQAIIAIQGNEEQAWDFL